MIANLNDNITILRLAPVSTNNRAKILPIVSTFYGEQRILNSALFVGE